MSMKAVHLAGIQADAEQQNQSGGARGSIQYAGLHPGCQLRRGGDTPGALVCAPSFALHAVHGAATVRSTVVLVHYGINLHGNPSRGMGPNFKAFLC